MARGQEKIGSQSAATRGSRRQHARPVSYRDPAIYCAPACTIPAKREPGRESNDCQVPCSTISPRFSTIIESALRRWIVDAQSQHRSALRGDGGLPPELTVHFRDPVNWLLRRE